jgi:hypothetical protein
MKTKDYYAEMVDKYNEMAEFVTVLHPESWSNEFGPKDWWAVCDDKTTEGHGGIVAYFFNEEDAISFRHEYIKGITSGLKK